jgi:hypothetical protein
LFSVLPPAHSVFPMSSSPHYCLLFSTVLHTVLPILHHPIYIGVLISLRLSKAIMFLQDNVAPQKVAITHQNLQILTLKFRNTRPTHLIWPLRTTTSFLTSV